MNKSLHILFLCSWYPSKVFPTNGDFIQRHADAVALKHKVSVLHIVSNQEVTKTEIDITEEGNITTYIAYVKPSSFFLIKWLRFWLAFEDIYRKIKSIDVVHVHRLYPLGLFAIYLKKFKKLNYIITEHWTGYHFTKQRPLSWFEKMTSKRIVRKAKTVCPVSDDLKKSMISSGLSGNYQRVPNVVNTELFAPRKRSTSTFTISHISDLNDDHKNISGMLRVASKLSKSGIKFTWNFIGGKKNAFSTLLSELDFHQVEINFIDHVPHTKIPEYLSNSDVFVLFSNFENLPCVILEAFSCGVPVISTNVGGIQEFFPEEFGYLINKSDESALEEKLLDIYENPIQLQSKMHQYAKDNFSPEKICDSFTKLYLEALN